MTTTRWSLAPWLLAGLSAFAAGCGDNETSSDPAVTAPMPDAAPEPLYDEPSDFDRVGCVAGSLAGLDPSGVWHGALEQGPIGTRFHIPR